MGSCINARITTAPQICGRVTECLVTWITAGIFCSLLEFRLYRGYRIVDLSMKVKAVFFQSVDTYHKYNARQTYLKTFCQVYIK